MLVASKFSTGSCKTGLKSRTSVHEKIEETGTVTPSSGVDPDTGGEFRESGGNGPLLFLSTDCVRTGENTPFLDHSEKVLDTGERMPTWEKNVGRKESSW